MPRPPAEVWQARQVRIVAQVDAALAAAWAGLDFADLTASWLAGVGAQTVRATSGGMLAAATGAQVYVEAVAEAAGDTPDPQGHLVPAAFATTASDGRPLASLLYGAVIGVKTRLGAGQSRDEAFAGGLADLLRYGGTQVQDAGRMATSVSLTADRTMVGWVRELRGASCSRCIVLAGRVYRWSHGFQRHPRCDCVHRPLSRSEWDRHETSAADDPRRAFDAMSAAQQDRVFTKAGAQAIRDGADPARVVNARRGMYETRSTGRLMTVEGTTNRGRLGVDLGKDRLGRERGRLRLMPEQIYREATSRDDAIRLLKLHGYLT